MPSSMNYYFWPDCYWVKGSTYKPLYNSGDESSLFPVALSKNGERRDVTALKLRHQ